MLQHITQGIQVCLGYARDQNLSSIGFPALGTGNLNMPASELGDCFLECAARYPDIQVKFKRFFAMLLTETQLFICLLVKLGYWWSDGWQVVSHRCFPISNEFPFGKISTWIWSFAVKDEDFNTIKSYRNSFFPSGYL